MLESLTATIMRTNKGLNLEDVLILLNRHHPPALDQRVKFLSTSAYPLLNLKSN